MHFWNDRTHTDIHGLLALIVPRDVQYSKGKILPSHPISKRKILQTSFGLTQIHSPYQGLNISIPQV